MTQADFKRIQGASTAFEVRDTEAHPPDLYSYIFATTSGTAILKGRFVDSSGRCLVVNPDALPASQVSLVTLTIGTAPLTFKALIVALGISGVTDIPAKADGFRGSLSAPVLFTTLATRDTNNAESFFTPIADYTPQVGDAQIPASTYVRIGRCA